MIKLKRVIMLLALLIILLLILLSIYASFVGAAKARALFTSLPLQIIWVVLALLLAVSLVMFPSLRRSPALLSIHAGLLLLLAGAFLASQSGHRLYGLLGREKLRAGRMVIAQGQISDIVALKDERVLVKLPFGLRLDDFRIEYYHPDSQIVRDFISDIKVIKDDKVVGGKSIEVNKPLHYGGYYFYQFSYDDKAGQYTVLSVASDSGLGLVFGGYLFLTVGVFWQLWSRKNLFAQRND